MLNKKVLIIVSFLMLTVAISGCSVDAETSPECRDKAREYSELHDDVEFECYTPDVLPPEILEQAPGDTKCYCVAKEINLDIFVTPGDQVGPLEGLN